MTTPDENPERTALLDVVVAVGDVARACSLYVGELGGAASPEASDGSVRVRYPDGPDLVVVPEGPLVERLGLPPGEGIRHVTFAVADLDGAASGLEALGYRVRPCPARPGSEPYEAEGVVAEPPPRIGGVLRLVRHADTGPRAPRPEALGRRVRLFDHACAAVTELSFGLDVFHRVLGGTVVFGGDNDDLQTRSGQVKFAGGGKIELLAPTGPANAAARFLQRSPGPFHHVTLMVHDLAATIDALARSGWSVVDTDLVTRPAWRETFLRPSQTCRALVQLVQSNLSYSEDVGEQMIADILAGHIDSYAYVMKLKPGFGHAPVRRGADA